MQKMFSNIGKNKYKGRGLARYELIDMDGTSLAFPDDMSFNQWVPYYKGIEIRFEKFEEDDDIVIYELREGDEVISEINDRLLGLTPNVFNYLNGDLDSSDLSARDKDNLAEFLGYVGLSYNDSRGLVGELGKSAAVKSTNKG